MRKANLIGLAALVASLAACGQSDPAEPQVAALPGASSSASAAASSENLRQLPLGATQEEIDRAYDAWYACWTKHGVPSAPDGGGPLLSYKKNQKKYQAAVDACADQEPLNPPEMDPQQNPDYADNLRAEKACLEGHGIKMEIRGTGDDASLWAVDTKANLAKANSDEGMEFYRQCEISAFTPK
ncbi:hypothetical protein [Paractinoplanes durhamensis]|nr:hypothetical protein [Actinoplanes durhamensis]